MYCNNCGAKNPNGAQFCSNCGQSLTDIDTRGEYAGMVMTGTAYPNPSFPIAGIFLIFHGSIALYRAGFDYYRWVEPVFVGIVAPFVWTSLLQILLISILVVLLFWKRMHKSTLILLLGYSAWSAISCAYVIYYSMLMAGRVGHSELLWSFEPLFIEVLSYIMLFSITVLSLRAADHIPTAVKKLWFIPGILNCVELIWLLFLGKYNIMSIILSPVLLLCMATENFLLGWWLSHPHKSQHINMRNNTSFVTQEHMNPTSGGVIDAPSFGYALLGFLFPMVGLILYLVWREQTPLRAKSAGKGALVGAISAIILTLALTVFSIIFPLMLI